MPRGDRTGPAGMGPMTGRAAGYCAGYPAPGYANPGGRGYGGGLGGGRGGYGGGGRGWRNMYWATGLPGWMRYGAPQAPYDAPAYPAAAPGSAAAYGPAQSTEAELEALKGQIRYMEESMKAARARIEELERQGEE